MHGPTGRIRAPELLWQRRVAEQMQRAERRHIWEAVVLPLPPTRATVLIDFLGFLLLWIFEMNSI